MAAETVDPENANGQNPENKTQADVTLLLDGSKRKQNPPKPSKKGLRKHGTAFSRNKNGNKGKGGQPSTNSNPRSQKRQRLSNNSNINNNNNNNNNESETASLSTQNGSDSSTNALLMQVLNRVEDLAKTVESQRQQLQSFRESVSFQSNPIWDASDQLFSPQDTNTLAKTDTLFTQYGSVSDQTQRNINSNIQNFDNTGQNLSNSSQNQNQMNSNLLSRRNQQSHDNLSHNTRNSTTNNIQSNLNNNNNDNNDNTNNNNNNNNNNTNNTLPNLDVDSNTSKFSHIHRAIRVDVQKKHYSTKLNLALKFGHKFDSTAIKTPIAALKFKSYVKNWERIGRSTFGWTDDLALLSLKDAFGDNPDFEDLEINAATTLNHFYNWFDKKYNVAGARQDLYNIVKDWKCPYNITLSGVIPRFLEDLTLFNLTSASATERMIALTRFSEMDAIESVRNALPLDWKNEFDKYEKQRQIFVMTLRDLQRHFVQVEENMRNENQQKTNDSNFVKYMIEYTPQRENSTNQINYFQTRYIPHNNNNYNYSQNNRFNSSYRGYSGRGRSGYYNSFNRRGNNFRYRGNFRGRGTRGRGRGSRFRDSIRNNSIQNRSDSGKFIPRFDDKQCMKCNIGGHISRFHNLLAKPENLHIMYKYASEYDQKHNIPQNNNNNNNNSNTVNFTQSRNEIKSDSTSDENKSNNKIKTDLTTNWMNDYNADVFNISHSNINNNNDNSNSHSLQPKANYSNRMVNYTTSSRINTQKTKQ